MRRIRLFRNGFQLTPFFAEIEHRVFNRWKQRLPTREGSKERLLHRRRPTRQTEQLDPARSLDHARIQRCVVGDVR